MLAAAIASASARKSGSTASSKGLVDLRLRHLQAIELRAVKLQRVLLQRRVAAGAHIWQ